MTSTRDQLRRIIQRADRQAQTLPAATVSKVLHDLDLRLAHAQRHANRSNRARGALRQLTRQRAAVIEHTQRQRQQAAAAVLEADQARQQLVAGAPPHLAAAVAAARAWLDRATADVDRLATEGRPLAARVAAEAEARQAEQSHAAALAAAIAWDPPDTAAAACASSARAPCAAAPPA